MRPSPLLSNSLSLQGWSAASRDFAAPLRRGWLVGPLIAWMIAAIIAGVAAWRMGVDGALAAGSTGLALAPAVVSLALVKMQDAFAVRGEALYVFTWLAFASAAAATTGGFASPLSAAYVLAPALARRLGGPALAADAVFFAALAFGMGGVAGLLSEYQADLGALPAFGAVASIALAGYWLAPPNGLGALTPRRAAPTPRAAPPKAPPTNPPSGEPSAAAGEEAGAAPSHTAALAHEMRTPLTHILGFSEMMQQGVFGPLNEKYSEYAGLIHASGRNLLDLVNSHLDFARLQAGRLTLERDVFDLNELAADSARLAADGAAGKGVTLAFDAAPETMRVNADPRAIRQILTNLISNAVKFTPEGGRVTLSIRRRNGEALIDVADTGPGIAPEDRARLAQAFERGSAAAGIEGVGLGLALVRGLAEMHGGALELLSAPGGGALVRVRAPIVAEG